MNGMTKSLRALLQSDISELAKLGDAGQFPTMGHHGSNPLHGAKICIQIEGLNKQMSGESGQTSYAIDRSIPFPFNINVISLSWQPLFGVKFWQ